MTTLNGCAKLELNIKNCNPEYIKNFELNFTKDDIFHIVRPVLETNNYIYLNFKQGMRSFYSLYNKKNNTTETGFLIVRNAKIAPVYGYPIAVYDDSFVSTIDAVRIVQAINENVIPQEYLNTHQDLKKIVKDIKENDNPIIMFSQTINSSI